MSYSIGQILFVVMRKENKVVPVQVIEEITRKTFKGTETTYRVNYGSDPQKQPIMIDQLAGDVFAGPSDVEKHMIEKTTAVVKRLVAVAVQRAKEWYASPAVVNDDEPDIIADEPTTVETTEVVLPGGVKAKARIVMPTDV